MFNGYCYYSSPDSSSTFDVASAYCKEANTLADVATIENQVENDYLSSQQSALLSYIGLQRTGQGSDWFWSDGSRDNFTNWLPGMPAGEGNCATMASEGGGWKVEQCNVEAGFHCKLQASSYLSCPLGWSLFNGHCYLAQDELLGWNDARIACNSKGGDLASVADEAEQSEIFALIHGPECPEYFQLIDGLCIFYSGSDSGETWDNAKAMCKEMDSTLAMPKSGELQETIRKAIDGHIESTGSVWMGMNDRQEEGKFKFVDGTPVEGGYTNWSPSDPNGGENENCGAIKGDGFYWEDQVCGHVYPYVCAKPKSDPKANRWIGFSDRGALNTFSWSDNSYVSYTHWGAGFPTTHAGQGDVCVYMDSVTGGWVHTFCHESMSSVCKTNQQISSLPPDHDGCRADQVAYGASCYDIVLDHLPIIEAEASCMHTYDAKLVTINTEAEQAKMTTIIAETDEHFAIGARWNDVNQTWEWATGEEWSFSNWASGEPDQMYVDSNNTMGWCVYMHRHYEVGKWRVVSCADSFSYICESPRQGYTTPPTTTTTTPAVLRCPTTFAKIYNGHCYEWFLANESPSQSGWSFQEGRDFCNYRFSGDLVSWGDMAEENWFYDNFVLQDGGWWLGYREDESQGYHWVDGTQSGYENWDENSPDSMDGKERCIYSQFLTSYNPDDYTTSYTHYWNNANCYTRLAVICEAVAQTDGFTTAPAPTRPPSIPCHEGDETWIMMSEESEFCYSFITDQNPPDYGFTWRQARGNCTEAGGDLVSLHSIDENNWVHNEMFYRGLSDAWLGLNRLSSDDAHEWSDNTAVDFTNWNDGEPNNAMGAESCDSINPDTGKWNDEQCADKHSYICKKPRDGSMTTEKTTPFPSGHCPQDWLEFEGRCYKFYGLDADTALNWTDARDACMNNSITRMHNAELASIHSSIQQAFIVAAATKYQYEHDYDSVWLGLNSIQIFDTWVWTDESEVDYANWNSDEPNGYGAEPCAEMFATGDHAGRWNDVGCGELRGYLCEIRAETSIPEPQPDWPPCDDQTMADKGFIKIRDVCYQNVDEAKTFSQAEDHCKEQGEHTHLLSVMDMVEEDVGIVLSFKEMSDVTWLGLSKSEVNIICRERGESRVSWNCCFLVKISYFYNPEHLELD